jgi:hypothetical protein
LSREISVEGGGALEVGSLGGGSIVLGELGLAPDDMGSQVVQADESRAADCSALHWQRQAWCFCFDPVKPATGWIASTVGGGIAEGGGRDVRGEFLLPLFLSACAEVVV